MSEKKKETRTRQQNKALHAYFRHVANALNEAGYPVQLVLRHKMDLDWNTEMVKELLWRPAQKAMLWKRSTRHLLKQGEIDTIYDHLNRHLSERFGIHVPFPTHELNYWDNAPTKND